MTDTTGQSNDEREPSLQQPGTLQSVLPPEALSLIFQHANSPYREVANLDRLRKKPKDRPFFPVFLGSISYTWRQVAWSTPQLWTTLSLSIPGDKTRATKLASLLELYLTNVRGLQIALSIELDYSYGGLEEDLIASVFFKEENLQKLGELRLEYPPTNWLYRFDGPFPHLVKIHLSCGGHSLLLKNTPILANAPMLREISLEHFSISPKAPWPLITILKLKDISTIIAVRCLLECPNLVEFHYYYPTDSNDEEQEQEEPPDIPSILTLPHLESLSWLFIPNPTSDLFLSRIRLPALRSLTWDQWIMDLEGEFTEGIRFFFRNLSCAPLTTLCLRNTSDIDLQLAKYIYRENPRIENLILEDCNEETLDVVLASLVPRWDDRKQVDEGLYLMKLKMLEVRGYESGEEYPVGGVVETLDAYLGGVIVDLLIGRAGTDFDSGFCVNIAFNGKAKMRWSPDAKQKLQNFDGVGTRVGLLWEGKQIDWL